MCLICGFFDIVSCNIVVLHGYKNSTIFSQIIATLNENVVEIYRRSSLGPYFYIDVNFFDVILHCCRNKAEL